MKKALLFFGLLASTASAQDCSKIFISEYVEGWSNNKALEIYNPTNQTINLSEYFVARYSNGSASATVQNAVQLSGTIAPYDVFVAVLEKLDPREPDRRRRSGIRSRHVPTVILLLTTTYPTRSTGTVTMR